MALTIATGFVVDDAIVMIENIARYIEDGEPPIEAALKGAAQIGFTIISLTVSLIAVLIPLLFMGDVVGRLFREFAVTLAIDHRHLGRRVADAHRVAVGAAGWSASRTRVAPANGVGAGDSWRIAFDARDRRATTAGCAGCSIAPAIRCSSSPLRRSRSRRSSTS